MCCVIITLTLVDFGERRGEDTSQQIVAGVRGLAEMMMMMMDRMMISGTVSVTIVMMMMMVC